jgi:hypothetical protein
MRTNSILRVLKSILQLIFAILSYILTFRWIREIIALIVNNVKERQRGEHLDDVRKGRPLRCSPKCAIIRPDVYKRADPLIYSQRYLMEQGLAVTWDNPDIQLYKDGTPISSSRLEADTDYEVIATVYNNSYEAPAVGLPVEFSYLGFGIGTGNVSIGTSVINLPVKGAPGHPAKAKMVWHTPTQEGHYCIQVKLKWSDDANPRNNLGQENTNVGHFSSPAIFEFPVQNDDKIRKLFRLVADEYTIPRVIDCKEKPKKENSERKFKDYIRRDVFVPPLEEEADWTFARVRNGINTFPVPQNWQVIIEPKEILLEPGQQQKVKVTISGPEDFRGEKNFNINAFYGNTLIGGVTLVVSK